MKKETRIDPLTGEVFIPKKSSQRFANPQNRIKYNNDLAGKRKLERAFIDKPLHANRNILKDILGNKKQVVVHEEFLKGRGYYFKVTTHYDKWEDRNVPCIYEFMIIKQSNGQIKILKNDRY